MADPNTRQGKRTPVTLKIKFKSETLEQFIERYAVDVSQGGIFIRTKEPLAVGTQMRFEFQLRDASPLIAGEGTVVWTRENDPSRPAIAPGMGVRFDRLAEGSQTVLEKILAEKAKQAPQRPANESTKPPMFTDTPTRVAPAPVQEALLGKSEDTGAGQVGGPGGPRRKRPDSFGDQGTPLPNPMPFHSDADEFPEEAFEEATKVRALDELIAQTADATKTAVTTPATPAAPDELAARRGVRADSTIADPPAPADKAEAKAPEPKPPAPVADRDSAPGLPSPPETDAKHHAEPKITPPAKTQLGLEPAKPARPGTPSTPPVNSPAPARPVAKDAVTKPTGMRAVAAEPKVPDAPAKSGPPVVLLLLLLLAIGGAAVWFFVIRPKGEDGEVTTKTGSGTTPGSGSANVVTSPGSGSGSAEMGSGSATAMGSNTGSAGSGSAGSAATGTGSGSAVAMTGSNTGSGGTTPGSGSTPPAVEMVETAISAGGADKVMIEVLGTDQTGASPLKAKLEKGKAYRARVQAPGFMIVEIDVKGGEKATAKLVAKPRFVTVTSEPPGAQILIDNANTGKTTPAEVELTKAQAGKKSVRVALRKGGMKTIERVVDGGKYTEDADKMIAKLDEKLEKAPVVVQQPNNNGGGNNTTNNNGGGKGSGSGSATPTNGGGTGSDTSGGGTGSSGSSGGGTGSASTGTGGTGGGAGTGGTGTGSSGTGTGTGTGSAAKPPTGTGTGSAKPPTGTGTGSGSATKPPPTGTGSGSSEPEPDFLK